MEGLFPIDSLLGTSGQLGITTRRSVCDKEKSFNRRITALADLEKDPDLISGAMTPALSTRSSIVIRYGCDQSHAIFSALLMCVHAIRLACAGNGMTGQ